MKTLIGVLTMGRTIVVLLIFGFAMSYEVQGQKDLSCKDLIVQDFYVYHDSVYLTIKNLCRDCRDSQYSTLYIIGNRKDTIASLNPSNIQTPPNNSTVIYKEAFGRKNVDLLSPLTFSFFPLCDGMKIELLYGTIERLAKFFTLNLKPNQVIIRKLDARELKFVICDKKGHPVRRGGISSNVFTLDISTLPNGLYNLSVYDEGSYLQLQRILKE